MSAVALAKEGIFRVARGTGAMSLVRRSAWRRRRLLILCYHGVSIDDEHDWNPLLYMRPERFRQRLRALARENDVLPLSEGLRRLRDGTLPRAAVSITVDDGAYDFLARAWPVLEEFALPVTVYQTTYYSEDNRPVFDPFVSYLLWKGRNRQVQFHGLLPGGGVRDLASAQVRATLFAQVLAFARAEGLDADGKDALLAALAGRIGVDLAALRARRILHLLTPGEIAWLAARGVDFQLHTHRHRTPDGAGDFAREIRDNRVRIEALTHRPATHFCYPSGVYRRQFLEWLAASDVESATTCDPGLASAASAPLLLPRLVDTEGVSDLAFEAWTSGLAGLLPRRTRFGDGANQGE